MPQSSADELAMRIDSDSPPLLGIQDKSSAVKPYSSSDMFTETATTTPKVVCLVAFPVLASALAGLIITKLTS